MQALLLLLAMPLSVLGFMHHFRPSPRVIIGAAVNAFETPFYGTLYTDFDDDAGTSVCGCALLGNGVGITAAHCVLRSDSTGSGKLQSPAALRVRLYGALQLSNNALLRIDIDTVKVTTAFRLDDFFGDIALFDAPGTFFDSQSLNVSINRRRSDWDSLQSWDKLMVIGVGLDEKESLSLGAPKVVSLSRRSCTNPVGYGNLLPWSSRWSHDDICSGPYGPCDANERCADSCRGDSGGPIFKTLPDGSIVLYGLVSRGATPCGAVGTNGGYPGINTPTDNHIPFIELSGRNSTLIADHQAPSPRSSASATLKNFSSCILLTVFSLLAVFS
jgi:secreted trypsin-like serine protease